MYDIMRQMIIEGELPPGERLKEEHLASVLNVSRTPLREALKRLQQDGFLTRHSQGLNVVPLTVTEFAELIELRVELEGLAARRAVRYALEPDIQRLRDIAHAVQEKTRDSADLGLNTEFHEALVESGHSRVLSETMAHLYSRILRYRTSFMNVMVRDRDLGNEYLAIVDAIAHRNAELAETLMRAHLLADYDSVLIAYRGSQPSSKQN